MTKTPKLSERFIVGPEDITVTPSVDATQPIEPNPKKSPSKGDPGKH